MSQGETSGINAFLSGGFGGMCLVAAGHPFDLIKVNIQTMPRPKPGEPPMYANGLDAARKMVARDGIKGLYRGMSAPLVGVTPIFSLCFWGYKQGDNLVVVMAPGERIKCLLQVQAQAVEHGAKPKYAGMLDCGKQLFREGGLKSLYRGWDATLLRDIPGSVAYFGAYEEIKRLLTPAGASPDHLSPLAVLVAGGSAGICNWLIAIPPDTLKSRLQTAPDGKYTGLVDVFRTLMREEGPAALFKGVGPAMARAFPANAACFLGMEVSKKFLHSVGI